MFSSPAPKVAPLSRATASSRWRRWLHLPQRAIDNATDATLWTESRALSALSRNSRRAGLVLVPLLVGTVAYLDYVTGHLVDAGVFYHLPVILSCVILGFRGLWIIPVCLGLYHANEVHFLPRPWPHSYGNDLAKIVSWSIMASVSLFARSLHLSLAEKSRHLAAKQRLADAEMALAGQVQRCLFNIPAEGYRDAQLTIHAHSTSLARVGGDFCRLVPQGEDLGLIVGDVVGKGVPAALVMAMCVTALTGAPRRSASPGSDLRRCNEVLYDSFTGEQAMTATACVGRFDRQTSEFVFSLAGHEPPIVLGDAEERPAWEPGILMGAVPEPEYAVYRAALRPGEKLLLFTDGATEARSLDGRELGRERLERIARRHASLPAGEALRRILAEIHAHVREAGLRDDLTLVILERL